MIDIIDVMLAKKMSTQGQVETIAANARTAVKNAQNAVEQVNAINEQAEALATRTETLSNQVEDTLEEVENALAVVDEAVLNSVEDRINADLNLSKSFTTRDNAVETDLTLNLMDGESKTLQSVVKNYKAIGNNEDGSMTQKAIKNYVNEIKTEIEDQISNIDFSNLSFSAEDVGHLVMIGNDGKLTVSQLTENDTPVIPSNPDSQNTIGTLGLEIDYANKNFTRTADAINKTAGANFNSYSMYGGRMRCNVSDDGTINAFYGDLNYTDNGDNGQVMVYQPRFYYRREPVIMTESDNGNSIRKEILYISNEKKTGFKLHPLFINENNEEIDYVLLPAYQGTLYDTSADSYSDLTNLIIDFENDKLSSINKDISPIASNTDNSLTVEKAEQLAKNRGIGWHITNMAAESANQMLFMIEYGQLNGQTALGEGIVNIPNSGKNCASWTGSTSYLGNDSGIANKTPNDSGGAKVDYTDSDKVAISYRGLENPWGNLWHFIGGINIVGNGNEGSGYPYICKNFNYNVTSVGNNYESTGFRLSSRNSWISAMGYKNPDYDWVFMPSECQDANSLLPVGDSIWITSNLNDVHCVTFGGTWESKDRAGLFYYGCDCSSQFSSAYSFGANLMFIPQKNSIYNQNITKWRNKFGGD